MQSNRGDRRDRREKHSAFSAISACSAVKRPFFSQALKNPLNAEREYERVWGRCSWRERVADVNPAAVEIRGDDRVDADCQRRDQRPRDRRRCGGERGHRSTVVVAARRWHAANANPRRGRVMTAWAGRGRRRGVGLAGRRTLVEHQRQRRAGNGEHDGNQSPCRPGHQPILSAFGLLQNARTTTGGADRRSARAAHRMSRLRASARRPACNSASSY